MNDVYGNYVTFGQPNLNAVVGVFWAMVEEIHGMIIAR